MATPPDGFVHRHELDEVAELLTGAPAGRRGLVVVDDVWSPPARSPALAGFRPLG